MIRRVSALALLLAAGAFAADRHKLDVDPETDDGILLQRIQQEPTLPRRLALLEKYSVQFPKTVSIAWVYDQLLSIYLEAKDNDKVIATAGALLAVDPDDLEAANDALRAAQSKGAAELVRKYLELAWDVAARVLKKPKPADRDDLPDWEKEINFAKQVQDYTEFTMVMQAVAEPDKYKKTEWVEALRSRNPQSRYLGNVKKVELTSMTPDKAAEAAEKGLVDDPSNEDFLMTIADFNMTHERNLPKAQTYALRVLELLRTKARPDSVTPEQWERKKAKFTGWASWMVGVVYGKDARYGPSDRYLRMALPYIQNDLRLLTEAYFYLGYDNYALASELNDKGRALEAVKFSKLCAATDGPYKSLALKNLESLRNEFSVE